MDAVKEGIAAAVQSMLHNRFHKWEEDGSAYTVHHVSPTLTLVKVAKPNVASRWFRVQVSETR